LGYVILIEYIPFKTSMKYLSVLLSLLISSCWNQSHRLEDKIQKVQFHYISWACACANWATSDNIEKYKDTGKLSDNCVFIEPANKLFSLSDTIGYSGDIVEFTGQYYEEKGFPNDYIKTEEPVDKAKIFRYTAFRVIKSNYHNYIHDNGK